MKLKNASKYCFLTIKKEQRNKQQRHQQQNKSAGFLSFLFYVSYFLIFAKGVCTPSCFLLIQLSVASHLQY